MKLKKKAIVIGGYSFRRCCKCQNENTCIIKQMRTLNGTDKHANSRQDLSKCFCQQESVPPC